ncbi:MAG: DEAD/DEAH box helicase family protein, partial [Candidatus Hydrogenedentes bacterium]|nr:DEAD/DEAH box helicase family protein [Candidatus Hydrogenedentota bacterium]
MQFFGNRADDAETAASLLAPSCEFNHRIGRWVFPLLYLPDVAKVLRKHVVEIRVSSKVAAAYRRQKKLCDAILGLKAKSTAAFAESPYKSLFRKECMPHPYQRQGIATMLSAKRLLLGDAVGLGKTIQSVGAISLAMERGICRRAMVVTSASLKGQWRDEAQKYLLPDAVSGLASDFTVVSGEKSKRIEIYRDPAARVIVLNYELFLHDLKHMPPVDMIVLDEAARIKNLDAQTTKNIKAFCAKHKIQYRYALTATAIENRLEDLFSILSFLGDRSLGFYTYFLYHYCRLRQFQAPNGAWIRQVVGHLNLAEAKRRTGHILLRRTKDDVGIELPELVIRNVAIDLTARQREEYEAIKVAAADPDNPLNPL